MTRAANSKPRRKGMVSEAERRASTDALNEWLAQRERPSKELQAKQARLLKILAKRALH
jgi:hypothetical protein